jgi:hypothetical protein
MPKARGLATATVSADTRRHAPTNSFFSRSFAGANELAQDSCFEFFRVSFSFVGQAKHALDNVFDGQV